MQDDAYKSLKNQNISSVLTVSIIFVNQCTILIAICRNKSYFFFKPPARKVRTVRQMTFQTGTSMIRGYSPITRGRLLMFDILTYRPVAGSF